METQKIQINDVLFHQEIYEIVCVYIKPKFVCISSLQVASVHKS